LGFKIWGLVFRGGGGWGVIVRDIELWSWSRVFGFGFEFGQI